MRDDRDDPFDEFFREIERVMDDVMGEERGESTGFGSDVHVSVTETDAGVRVLADLPGVEQEALRLRCDGRVLTITAESDDGVAGHAIEERVRLPTRVDEESASATFNNGVLEVTFEAAEDAADIDLEE